MYTTHTILFLDYAGKPDWDMYSATCCADAYMQFTADHPGRKVVIVGEGMRGEVLDLLVKSVGDAPETYRYQGVYQEEQTGVYSVHEFDAPSDEEACAEYLVTLDIAKTARDIVGGFTLYPTVLWKVYPPLLIQDFRD